MSQAPDHEDYDAVIVGAGLAGLYQLYRLRQLGLRSRVIEAADGVGGTWFWNRYPGARCDVQSLSYSYSFSPELEQDWEWTEKYPTQPEILRYLNHVAERFDLTRDITFGTRVLSARYAEAEARWTLQTDKGKTYAAQFLIMATGCLSASKLPEIPGLERYRGRTHHTANWGKDEVRFDGLKVGVIGTGSSGIQSIPIIAEQAADLTVFQRTPNFSMPASNRPLEPGEVARMKANYRAWREAQRTSRAGIPMPEATESALAATADERAHRYQAAWEKGPGLTGRLLRRHSARPGGQRDGSRVHPLKDPRGRARSGGCRDAVAAQLPLRDQAPVPRYRLLPDVQPAERAPG